MHASDTKKNGCSPIQPYFNCLSVCQFFRFCRRDRKKYFFIILLNNYDSSFNTTSPYGLLKTINNLSARNLPKKPSICKYFIHSKLFPIGIFRCTVTIIPGPNNPSSKWKQNPDRSYRTASCGFHFNDIVGPCAPKPHSNYLLIERRPCLNTDTRVVAFFVYYKKCWDLFYY